MIYSYECKFHGEFDVVKMHTRYCLPEPCPVCRSEMTKVMKAVRSFIGTFKPGFNFALGKTFETKRQQDEHIKFIEYKTGKKLIEVGNEKLDFKPEMPKVNLEEAKRELHNKWQRS